MDLVAYSGTVYKNLTTKDPGCILHPAPLTLKDKFYRIFKNTTTITCLAGSAFALAYSCNYIEEFHPAYESVTNLATIVILRPLYLDVEPEEPSGRTECRQAILPRNERWDGFLIH